MSAFADMLVFEMSKKAYCSANCFSGNYFQTVLSPEGSRECRCAGRVAEAPQRWRIPHDKSCACPRFTVCSAASRGPVPNRSSLSSGMSHDHSRSDIFVRKMPIKAFSRGIAEQNRLQAAVGGNMFFPLNEQPGAHFTKRRRLPGHGAGVFAEYSSRFFKNRRLRGRTLLHSTS